ncbi:response regulator transcription factor [Carnobacterium gallinarum]|uniref:response regulator transcription factor n=1 Tax=Carnobacterium gallinarum TaxID=2749 RepID=UPI0005573978|nr:response regulator transcription factor [Carnobacterium gallinarum]
MRKVLIVEDDNDINKLLSEFLIAEGYFVRSAFSGTEVQFYTDQTQFDLILLDLMLPGINGEEIIQVIRRNEQTPIIVISAKSDKETKIEVLKSGADDFVTKPFDLDILLARIEATLRRSVAQSSETISEFTHKGILLQTESRKVYLNKQPLKLTNFEFDILALLLSNPKKVFTKSNIFESVWQEESLVGDDGTVSVHISHLRTKFSKISPDNAYIDTVWGIGFKMNDD